MPLRITATASSPFSDGTTCEAIALREWSSSSWKITHLRPPTSTYSVASNCQHALGADRQTAGTQPGASCWAGLGPPDVLGRSVPRRLLLVAVGPWPAFCHAH